MVSSSVIAIFTGEETETQGGSVTCPRLQIPSQEVRGSAFYLRPLTIYLVTAVTKGRTVPNAVSIEDTFKNNSAPSRHQPVLLNWSQTSLYGKWRVRGNSLEQPPPYAGAGRGQVAKVRAAPKQVSSTKSLSAFH